MLPCQPLECNAGPTDADAAESAPPKEAETSFFGMFGSMFGGDENAAPASAEAPTADAGGEGGGFFSNIFGSSGDVEPESPARPSDATTKPAKESGFFSSFFGGDSDEEIDLDSIVGGLTGNDEGD